MVVSTDSSPRTDESVAAPPTDSSAESVGGPVPLGWREGTLTRARELESLAEWFAKPDNVLTKAVRPHLTAAREAATAAALSPKQRRRLFRNGPLMERAISNLDAAEAHLLQFAPPDYLLGQLPCLLRHVQCHLVPTDPRRLEFQRIARRLGLDRPSEPAEDADDHDVACRRRIVEQERGRIAAIVRGASSAALREQVRVRSFRNVVVVTTVFMAVLAIAVAVTGWLSPTMIPLCFAPEDAGQAIVVCPTAQSERFVPSQQAAATTSAQVPVRDIDDVVAGTATWRDLLVVELIGLTAAAVAAAGAIRNIRGSSERYGLPVALAALKLPTGAVTAALGLLLMRAQFVPGLSALDTSAQILGWALVFGYAQQLFTRLVDRQGHSVLDSVRGADRPQQATTAA
jgi:hypothetical protein